ncbi:sugar ABC transporter permease [Telmatospirillum sp.]|uniref:carbohydrate ABC transporter permease n=1 Tax=Telmatospirillum sp. TaxID=2079197 RepID=UPI00284C9E4C|nr:sugar ABC transporter permease [Telmatospirillum sp.]MDR3438665.1 sugar ABC transporter permease [Telmatospirillum sp.]
MFWDSLGRTAIWIGLTVPLQLALGFVTALLLNRNFWWRPLARSLILIPWALPSVVIGLMWSWIYHPQVGVLNDLLMRCGMLQSAMPWLANPDTALYAIIAALVWQGFPFFAIMILAGLQTIPGNLYEAASIDGATTWQKFLGITLPGLKGVLVTAVMLRIIWVANSMDVIYVMTGGGPGYATHTLPLYAFKRTYSSMDFGYGSALAVTFSLVLLVLITIYLRRVGKDMK